jgi:DNA-binding transcriptional LysR family regulator
MSVDHRITLQKLEVFCLVVELGGVSRAADQLFVTQPVVTAHVRSLEQRLGVRLFERKGRGLSLTEAGLAAHEWAGEVLAHTREFSRRLGGLEEGTRGAVVVGASMSVGSYLLPPLLSDFHEEQPLVELELDISDSYQAVQQAEMGKCDFAVVISAEAPAQAGLEGELLGREELVLVTGPDSDPRDESVPVARLSDLPFIDSPKGSIRRQLFDRQLAGVGVHRRNVVIELGHPEAMKRAAERGLGVTLLFRSAVQQELAGGRLREVGLRDASLAAPLYLVYRRAKVFSPAQGHLLDAVRRDILGAGRN